MAEPGQGDGPWWRKAVIYEIYVRSFQDGNGDGVGDLAGVLSRVDYLAALGVDAVWLTPFYPSPMADFGYDVSDYRDVDPLFGTLADFDRLVAALGARGIRVIVDFVPNHTSDRHPWFVESRASRDSPRRDWYVWRDPAPDGGPPNNWRAQPDGPAWTFDAATGQYYLHSFLDRQPDLNWRNPAVRAAMFDALRFWLDRGVAGVRVDVLDRLLKDERFRDDPPNPDWREGDPDFMRLRTVHSADQPEILDLVADMRAVLAEYPGERVLIGEIYQPVETLVRFYGRALEAVHLPFNFNLMWLVWIPEGVRLLAERYEAGLPPGAWPSWVLGNHDQSRVASRFGERQARVAMLALLTLRGTPTIYQGDELGLADTPIPPGRERDPFARAGPAQGRDKVRTPMPWDGSRHAGFSAAEPWLPVGEANAARHALGQEAGPASFLSFTRAALALRRREKALALGDWRGISARDGVLVYERRLGGDVLLVALNMRGTPGRVRLDGPADMLLSTEGPAALRAAPADFELRPDEGVVLRPRAAGPG
ncbi:alpha-amylase family glycosyl hydrolase [Alsobacter sp. SYSU M60028]|uniref:Alpha-amylase family glycosyl hydrolase n=1 Tax=Alsobacter ponti TaxID=2962936 RepID=A0ABT1LHN5_9HYPH|nr:alpha-amylase family glycosyl hydrolase [Alsobacter ponti]MCP8940969.1 alpha-amylase family glycosyl hydrolase [Alsobacter ponti]